MPKPPPRKRVKRLGTLGTYDPTQWPEGANETIERLTGERDELLEQRRTLRDALVLVDEMRRAVLGESNPHVDQMTPLDVFRIVRDVLAATEADHA